MYKYRGQWASNSNSKARALWNPGPEKPRISGNYLKSSLAALLALSTPEPPPFFLLLVLPLEPFFEDPSTFFITFLASFSIPAMWLERAPFSSTALLLAFLPYPGNPKTAETRPESRRTPASTTLPGKALSKGVELGLPDMEKTLQDGRVRAHPPNWPFFYS